MVQTIGKLEQADQGDGIERTVHYASFRTDKEPSPGYSAELISTGIEPKYYDDIYNVPLPLQSPETDTFLKLFKRNVSERANEPFLGTRK